MFFCVEASGVYLPKGNIFINKGLLIRNEPKIQNQYLPVFKFLYCKGSFLVPYSFGLSRMLTFYITETKKALDGYMGGFKRALGVTGMGYKYTLTSNLLVIKLKFTAPVVLKLPKFVKLILVKKNRKVVLFSKRPNLLISFATKLRKIQKLDPYTLKGVFYFFEKLKKKIGKKPLY